MKKPYGANAQGHANKCDCSICARAKAHHFRSALTKAMYPRPPESAEQTVFVRSFFRRQPGHLKRYPRTRRLIQRILKGVL